MTENYFKYEVIFLKIFLEEKIPLCIAPLILVMHCNGQILVVFFWGGWLVLKEYFNPPPL